MAHRSTQMRRKMKEEEPEKYEEFLARNRERNKAKSAEKKAAWEQETHTRAQIEEQERKKKKKRARDRERYQRKKAEGTRQTRNSSIAGTCSSEGPPRKKLKDMSSGERRQYNSASRKRQRDAQSSQKKTAINAKRRADYKAKQEAEAQALNTSSEVNLPKPSSSRLRQSLYNLNHEYKKKTEQLGATSAEFAQTALNLVNLRTPEKRVAIMSMQANHPCKVLFVVDEENDNIEYDVEAELGIDAEEVLE